MLAKAVTLGRLGPDLPHLGPGVANKLRVTWQVLRCASTLKEGN